MKRGWSTEEQIIAVLREHEAGAKMAGLARKHEILQATLYNWKGRVWRHGHVRGQAAAAARRREPQSGEAVDGIDVGQRRTQGASFKGSIVRPSVARLFALLSEAVCVNVSGRSRLSCCCSQAMMRCARIVPNKWVRARSSVF